MQKESTPEEDFFELQLTGEEPAWCIDGRPETRISKGPQMPGGSLFPIIISAIYNAEDLNPIRVTAAGKKLQNSGYRLGVHRGEHKKPETKKSDCGLADNLVTIFTTVIDKKAEISQRLTEVYEQNREIFAGLSRPFPELLPAVYEKIAAYPADRLKLSGEDLIATVEGMGAEVQNLEGSHQEKTAFVNVKIKTTLDVLKANQEGKPAFNLDLWAATEQAAALGVDTEFAMTAALIFYQATEMVLVEDKGKPGLAIKIHS